MSDSAQEEFRKKFMDHLAEAYFIHQIKEREADFCKTGLPEDPAKAEKQFAFLWNRLPKERQDLFMDHLSGVFRFMISFRLHGTQSATATAEIKPILESTIEELWKHYRVSFKLDVPHVLEKEK